MGSKHLWIYLAAAALFVVLPQVPRWLSGLHGAGSVEDASGPVETTARRGKVVGMEHRAAHSSRVGKARGGGAYRRQKVDVPEAYLVQVELEPDGERVLYHTYSRHEAEQLQGKTVDVELQQAPSMPLGQPRLLVSRIIAR